MPFVFSDKAASNWRFPSVHCPLSWWPRSAKFNWLDSRRMGMLSKQNYISLQFVIILTMSYWYFQLQCCGIEGPKDWDRNIYFNCSSAEVGSREACGVPFSCCKPQPNVNFFFKVTYCNKIMNKNYVLLPILMQEIIKNKQCGYDVRKSNYVIIFFSVLYFYGLGSFLLLHFLMNSLVEVWFFSRIKDLIGIYKHHCTILQFWLCLIMNNAILLVLKLGMRLWWHNGSLSLLISTG